MTVAELIEQLKTMPPDVLVIVQADSEGNGYIPLASVDGDAIYTAVTASSGDVVSTEWTWQEACFDSAAAWDEYRALQPRCCVLVPVN